MISDQVPAPSPDMEPSGGIAAVTRAPRPPWMIPVVGAVVLLAAVIGVVAGLTLNGNRSAGSAAAAGYVPADATMYYELHLDLPGSQRANLRTFLGHFPGVDADKYLTDEIDKQLDGFASQLPGGGFTYSADVKPWFDGTLAVATIGVPNIAGATGTTAPRIPQTLLFAGVRDADAAKSVGDRLRAEMAKEGVTVTSTTHGSATIWTATGVPATTGGTTPQPFAWTITSDQVVAGTNADLVASALDVHAGSKPSLANRQEFRDGLSRLPADRVQVAAIDVAALLEGMKKDLSSLQPGAGDALNTILAQSPAFVVTSSSILGDRITLDTVSQMPQGASLPANSDSGLADAAPGDAILFVDGADVGKGLTSYVNAIKKAISSTPEAATQLQQVESILGGDLGSFVSWIGDAALVAGETGQEPYVGVIINPTDAGAARTKLGQLRGLLQLAAAGGIQLSVTDADHRGTTVTTIKVADAGADTPAWASTFQYAVTDAHVVFGNGETFVGRVLDMDKAHSLAGQSRFASALESVGGTSNVGSVWVDLAALRAALEPLMPRDMAGSYQREVKPWVAPFDYVVGVNRADGQTLVGKAAIAVK